MSIHKENKISINIESTTADVSKYSIRKLFKLNSTFKERMLDEHIKYKSQFRKNCGKYTKERIACIEQLKNSNTKYHLTLQFSYETNELKVKSLFKELMRHLNIRVYKNRFRNGDSYINGYVVMERTEAKETFHMHVLLGDTEFYPEKELLIKWLNKQVSFTQRVDSKNYISDFKLQNYYNLGSDDIEHYLTKNFEFLSKEKAASTIAPLSGNGAEFG